MSNVWTPAEYNALVDCGEARYRLFLKRELKSRGVSYDVLESTESLKQKLEVFS